MLSLRHSAADKFCALKNNPREKKGSFFAHPLNNHLNQAARGHGYFFIMITIYYFTKDESVRVKAGEKEKEGRDKG